MAIVLKGERQIEAGGVTFTLRPEKLGDAIFGRQQAQAQGLKVEGGSFAALGFSLIPRITAMGGVVLPDGTPAPATPQYIGELFEQEPGIMFELIAKAFGIRITLPGVAGGPETIFEGNGEASVSKNLETSQPGTEQESPELAGPAGTAPESAE